MNKQTVFHGEYQISADSLELSYDIGKYILQHIATDKHVDHD